MRISFFVIFLGISLLNIHFLYGQTAAIKSNDIEIKDLNNQKLDLAWAGGLNSPQFSEIDLNFDGIQDLFVFDRDGNRIVTFLNSGTSGKVDYTYAPEYIKFFPELYSWVLLRDYNNDGKADIFTYNNGGIRVFKNTSTLNQIAFTLEVSPFITSYYDVGNKSNLYVSSQDIPVIDDIDGDGDLDVLSFGPSSIAVDYHENFAADSGTLEDFNFYLNTRCWGRFEETQLTNQVLLNKGCPRVKSMNKHAGSTIMAFDQDGDGDKELLLGDASYTNLVYLFNGGDPYIANMTSQDTLFPSYDKSVDIQLFPAAFYLDVNNDGLKDLIVSPNAQTNMQDHEGVWYYRNSGSSTNAKFTFEQNDFLEGDMIDLGTGAYPTLFDYNFDGKQDLVIGNFGYYRPYKLHKSSLALLENDGSLNGPTFAFKNEDFGGISSIFLNTNLDTTPTLNIIPTFGDLNGDGFYDMIIGDFQGRLHYFENDPTPGYSTFDLVEVDYQDIQAGQYASPQLYDLDSDGLLDLVVGNRDGKVQFYRNIGTKNKANFELITKNLGEVNTKKSNDFEGYCQPTFYRSQSDLYLICGSKNGYLYHYGNIRNNLSGKFDLLDSMYLGIKDGIRSRVVISDLDNDEQFEIITGNSSGGMTLYQTDIQIGIEESPKIPDQSFNVQFNWLKNNSLEILILGDERNNSSSSVKLYSIIGQQIIQENFKNKFVLDLSKFTSGVYLVSVESGKNIRTEKIILTK